MQVVHATHMRLQITLIAEIDRRAALRALAVKQTIQLFLRDALKSETAGLQIECQLFAAKCLI